MAKAASGVLGENATISIVDGRVLLTPKGDEANPIELRLADLPDVHGEWDSANRVIAISRRAGDLTGAKITHEVLHAMRDLGFITNRQWSTLIGISDRLLTAKKKVELAKLYPDLVDNADAFAHEKVAYVLENLESFGIKKLNQAMGPARVWATKARAFLTDLADSLMNVDAGLSEKDKLFLQEVASCAPLKKARKPLAGTESAKRQSRAAPTISKLETIPTSTDPKAIGFATANGELKERGTSHHDTANALGYETTEALLQGQKAVRLAQYGPIATIQVPFYWDPSKEQVAAIKQWVIDGKFKGAEFAVGLQQGGALRTPGSPAYDGDFVMMKDISPGKRQSREAKTSTRSAETSKTFAQRYQEFKARQNADIRKAATRQGVPETTAVRGIFGLAKSVAAAVRKVERAAAKGSTVNIRQAAASVLTEYLRGNGTKSLPANKRFDRLLRLREELDIRSAAMTNMDAAQQEAYLRSTLPDILPERAKYLEKSARSNAASIFNALKDTVDARLWDANQKELLDMFGDGQDRKGSLDSMRVGSVIRERIQGLQKELADRRKPFARSQELRKQLKELRNAGKAENDVDMLELKRELNAVRKEVQASKGDYDRLQQIVVQGLEIREHVAQAMEAATAQGRAVSDKMILDSMEDMKTLNILSDLEGPISEAKPSIPKLFHRMNSSKTLTLAQLGLQKVENLIKFARIKQTNMHAQLQYDHEQFLAKLAKDNNMSEQDMAKWHSNRVAVAQFNGKPVKMTVAQRISLRAYRKDAHAWSRIVTNGFKPLQERALSTTYPGALAVEIVDADLGGKQKDLEEQVASWMIRRMGEFANNEGNAASKQVFGIDLFSPEPIYSLTGAVDRQKVGDPDVETMLDFGGTQRTEGVKNADIVREREAHGNPIIIQDSETIYNRWIRKAATFAAWAQDYQTVTRTLRDPQIAEVITKKLGTEKYNQMLEFVDLLTYQKSLVSPEQLGRLSSKVVSVLTGRQLAFSFSAGMQNRVGGKLAYYYQMLADGNDALATEYRRTSTPTSKYRVRGINPWGLKTADEAVLQELETNSGFLRQRWDRTVFSRMLKGGVVTEIESHEVVKPVGKLKEKIKQGVGRHTYRASRHPALSLIHI